MRVPVRLAVRFVAMIVVLGLVAVVSAPARHGTGGPYISALRTLGPAPALAASCPNKQCINNTCQHSVGWTCKSSQPGNGCTMTIQCT